LQACVSKIFEPQSKALVGGTFKEGILFNFIFIYFFPPY
jgi:hypothetical protein